MGEPEALSPPADCYEQNCYAVESLLFTGLLAAKPGSNELENQHAESIETKDSKVWTVKLKPGWKFHNGEEVNADSYIRAWNYGAFGPNAARANFFFERIDGYEEMNIEKATVKELKGLKKIDDATFEITLTEPFAQWPTILTTYTFLPMAQACFDDMTKCNEHPIGNGPYEMDGDWEHNQLVKVKKWAGYTGPNAGNADTINMKIYTEIASSVQDMLSGQVDIVPPTADQIETGKTQPGVKYFEEPNSQLLRLTYSWNVKEFQNADVRRAISMAIDRKAITDTLYTDHLPADDIIAPVIPGYKQGACTYCAYNPTEAKALLEKAGGWTGGTMKIYFPSGRGYDPQMEAIGNQIQQNLGIAYELKAITPADFYATKEFDGPRLGVWSMDYSSPENYLRPQFSNTGLSTVKWQSDEFEKLLTNADAQKTVEESNTEYRKVADLVNTEMPSAPLFFGKAVYLYSEKLGGFRYDQVVGNPDLRAITVAG